MSHTFEGPLAHAAATAFALAAAPDTVAGLGIHAGLRAWTDIAPGHLDGDTLCVPSAPGLGWRGDA